MISNSNSLNDAVIVFQIAGKRCACSVDFIREVAKASSIYKIPNNHPLVEGILNLRGMIIPVIKFSSLLNQHVNESESHLVLIAHVSSFYVGLLVDHVFKVEKLANKAVTEEASNQEEKEDIQKKQDQIQDRKIDVSWVPRRFLKEIVRLESGLRCPLLDSKSLSQALWAYVPDRERGE